MGGGIAQGPGAIVRDRDHPPVLHDGGPDGDFTLGLGLPGRIEG